MAAYRKRVDQGVCPRCGDLPITGHLKCIKCAQRDKETIRRTAHNLRHEVFMHYGGYICANSNCQITDPDVLTIDHIEGRKSLKHNSYITGERLYRWIRAHGFPNGFQVLCMNCNYKKHLQDSYPSISAWNHSIQTIPMPSNMSTVREGN